MKNDFYIIGEQAYILLKSADGSVRTTVIDSADLEIVQMLPGNWHASWYLGTKSFYCHGHIGKKNICLQRLITNCPPSLVVDHINHDTLDNRRSNLRLANRSENAQNRVGANANNASGVRGATYEKDRGLWRAEVRVKGLRRRLGRFTDLREAEKAAKVARSQLMPFSPEAREDADDE